MSMRKAVLKVFLLACFLCNFSDGANVSPENYWDLRAQFLVNEESMSIGMNSEFEKNERIANKELMTAKKSEIDEGFQDPSRFLPSQNFLLVRNDIKNSRVFKIIQTLPKGATLHAHDTAIVCLDYVFWNITFRPNLYLCEEKDDLKLKFFDVPDSSCNWQLLKEVREKDPMINLKIIGRMSMETKYPEKHYPDVNAAWKKFVDIFLFITPMLTYRPVYEDHFYRGLQELLEDNVLYLELRSTLPTLYDLNGTTYGPLEVANIYKNVTDKFVRDNPNFMGMKLIFAPIRKVALRTFDDLVNTANQLKRELPNFIAGFDLVGQEDKGEPLINFTDKIANLDKNINLFFHAGETNWFGASTDENLVDAVLLGSKRIGHGFAITKHPKVMDYVKERDIAIEINPISNQVLGLVRDLRNHPASVLFAQNFPLVISNDDPGLWGARALSYDFYEAFMGIMSNRADLRALKKLATNSIKYSSMNEDEKAKAFEIWRRQWDSFVTNLAAKNI